MKKIQTYSDLSKHVNAFGKRKINLLFVISRGGLGKTTISEDALIEHDPLVFKGHVTPLHLYKSVYEKNEEEKDFLLILDDVDGFLANKINVTLLKQLCETKKDKHVFYNSTTHLLKNIKPDFETSCKVLLLLNDIDAFSENASLKALITRGHLISFEPTNEEILKYLKTYAEDIEIFNFMNKYSVFSTNLNLRTYEKAVELKQSNLDWRDEVIQSLNIDKKLIEIDMLLGKYETDIERLKHFSGSRMTYYRYKKKILQK